MPHVSGRPDSTSHYPPSFTGGGSFLVCGGAGRRGRGGSSGRRQRGATRRPWGSLRGARVGSLCCVSDPPGARLSRRLKADHTGPTLNAHLISRGPAACPAPHPRLPRPAQPRLPPYAIYLRDKHTCRPWEGPGERGSEWRGCSERCDLRGVGAGQRAAPRRYSCPTRREVTACSFWEVT